MDSTLTPAERTLVAHAHDAIVRYNTVRQIHGGCDTLYAFILAQSGAIYDGACFEPTLKHATVCGERHASATMILHESYAARIRSIVVADPVPAVQDNGTPPCGTCRHLIWTYGLPDTSVILMQYIQELQGWTFPKLEKYLATDLYPHPYQPIEGLWDHVQPN